MAARILFPPSPILYSKTISRTDTRASPPQLLRIWFVDVTDDDDDDRLGPFARPYKTENPVLGGRGERRVWGRVRVAVAVRCNGRPLSGGTVRRDEGDLPSGDRFWPGRHEWNGMEWKTKRGKRK
jgi:hypothetical protein